VTPPARSTRLNGSTAKGSSVDNAKKDWEVPVLSLLGDLETLTAADRWPLPGELIVAQVTGPG
jgi:hypothetical protein